MEAFREMIRGRLGKALLALLLLPFALVGIESYFVGGGASPAAEVNGEKIPMPELDKAMERQKQDILASLGPDADASRIDTKVLREELLRKLVEEALLKQQARKAGYLITDAEFARIISSQEIFQENGKFSQSRYEQYLRSVGEDPVTFPQQAKERMAQRQLMSGIVLTGLASGKEVRLLNRLATQKRDVHVAIVAASPFLGQVQLKEEEISQEYKQHPERYTSEEQVVAEYVTLSPDFFQSQATVTDADIEQLYAERVKAMESNEQRRASHILIKVDDKVKDADALAMIRGLEKRIKAGEDFGQLAREFSQDTGSAASNGDLGMSGKGMFVPEFEKALYALQPQQVSEPVKTQFGYHLIKLLEIQKPVTPPMAAIRAELETEARQAKAEDLYHEAVEKLDTLAYESSDLKELATQYSLKIEQTAPFTRKGGEGMALDRKFVQSAFSDDLLRDGKNSGGIRLDDKGTVWLRVKQHLNARLLPLSEVSGTIRLALQYDKASAMARARAEAAVKELAAGKAIGEVAASQQIQWMDFPGLTRSAPAPSQDVIRTAFRLPEPKSGTVSAAVQAMGKDVAVVAVTRVEVPATDLPDDQLKQMKQAQGGMSGQQELMDYVEYLRSAAEIVVDAPSDKP